MLRFKHFLIEKLTSDQEREVSTWERDPEAIKHTDHFFGVGNDEINEPLSGGHSEKSEPHKAVERHLGQEIDLDSYKKGLAKDKYGRDVKIGSLLQKTKAPQELVNGFANDSTRQLKKAEGLTVKVTRSPAGVAGQTSRGQSWEDQSCKNYETGSNRGYLKHEVKHGTVVAYLMHPNGTELARATLHPHHNDEGHVAYDVDSHYGVDHAEFKKHVDDLAIRLSGEHKSGNLIYNKHPAVYNDSGKESILHPNVTSEKITELLNHPNTEVRMVAVRHPKATADHITQALQDQNSLARTEAVQNPNANIEHISKALDDEDSFVRSGAIRHPKVTSEHISKALNDKDYSVRLAATAHPNLTKDHITQALNDEDSLVRSEAIRHPKVTPMHILKALNDEDRDVRMQAIAHRKINANHISAALDSKDAELRAEAAGHPKATADHISKALNDENNMVRIRAAKNPNANIEHISKALNDDHEYVRAAAITHPNATKDHLKYAMDNDKNSFNRERARIRFKYMQDEED